MLPPQHPDRMLVAFDDDRLIANSGRLLSTPPAWVWVN